MASNFPPNAPPTGDIPFFRPAHPGPGQGDFQMDSNRPPQFGPLFPNMPPPDMSRPPPGFMPSFPFPSQHQPMSDAESNANGTSAQIGSMLHKLRQSVDRMSDQQYVESWLKSKGYSASKSKPPDQRGDKKSTSITLPDARKLLLESVLLLEMLKNSSSVLHQGNVMVRLKELQSILTDETTLQELKAKVAKAATKRERLKRKRRHDYEEKIEAETKREFKHEKLDKWRDQMTQKALDLKKEKDLKACADSTLMEVRKKLADVSRFEDILTSLEKLRNIRLEKLRQKGLDPGTDGERTFRERESNMTQMLATHRKNYEEEKRGLEVILETEKEEIEEKQRATDLQRQQTNLKKYEDNLHKYLFGPKAVFNADDAMLPFTQYQLSAETQVSSLIHIRHEWDSFLVPPDVPGASSVPVSWICPSEPSDTVWEAALMSKHNLE